MTPGRIVEPLDVIERIRSGLVSGAMDVANINFAAGGRMLCSLRLAGAAIVFGSVVALRQERLKLLLAGGLLQAVPHATAKAAMFMAAGRSMRLWVRIGSWRWAVSDGYCPSAYSLSR